MAFTGVAAFQKVTDVLVRITGLSLAAGADGILALFGGTTVGAVVLPENPTHDWTAFDDVSLIESIQVLINPVTDVSNFGIPIRVVKTGVDVGFAITLTNDAAAVGSADLEIYVRYH